MKKKKTIINKWLNVRDGRAIANARYACYMCRLCQKISTYDIHLKAETHANPSTSEHERNEFIFANEQHTHVSEYENNNKQNRVRCREPKKKSYIATIKR